MTRVAEFQIAYTRYLDPDARETAELPALARDVDGLREAYRSMVFTRAFDSRAVSLQRTGKLGTYAASLGEEAIAAAVGLGMRPDDVLVPTYRNHGAYLARGVTVEEMLLYWGGDERGMDFGEAREDLPVAVPIASQAPHAVGVAYAFKYRRQPRVAVCLIGDGGTSQGAFYEAINAAGAWELPAVFVVVNNQWAISVPRHRQTRAETLAQKAVAAGIPGEQVDGNDYLAARERLDAALEKARDGGGPTLIEALTYRMGDHTTADDARRYRSDEELEQWRAQDPLARLRAWLLRTGALSEDDDERLSDECARAVDEAIDRYFAMDPQPPESMFDYLYESLPEDLVAQRRMLTEGGADG